MQTKMELLLNSNKIKYSVFTEMIKEVRLHNTINFYIDVNSLFDILYRNNNLEQFHTISREDELTISSQVINTIAHYRHYFFSRLQKATIFYLIYSNDKPSRYYQSLCSDYKKDYMKLRLDKSNNVTSNLQNNIERNMRLATSICKYIPNAYVINVGRNDVGATIQYLIDTETNKSSSNLVYTNDKTYYQLVNNENTYVIYNKQDNSKFVTRANLYKVLTKKDDIDVPSDLYKVSLAISGYKKYNLSGVKGVQTLKSLRILQKAIDKDIIYNMDYNSIKSILDKMIEHKLLKEEDRSVIERNFQLLNLNLMSKVFSDAYLDSIDSQMINNTDYDQIIEVSNKYYPLQPLMFLELLETFI